MMYLMGYTHYFEQSSVCPADKWALIGRDAKKAIAWVQSQGIPLAFEYDKPNKSPVIDDLQIRFNGVGEDGGHETMRLDPSNVGFQFCKTATKPYDLAVCLVLLIAHQHAPGVWNVRSDGDGEDWKAAAKAFNDLFGSVPNLYDENYPDLVDWVVPDENMPCLGGDSVGPDEFAPELGGV